MTTYITPPGGAAEQYRQVHVSLAWVEHTARAGGAALRMQLEVSMADKH